MSVDSQINERALREIYLKVFETAIRASKPWTVMSSYNKVNGKYVGENHELLTDIMRDDWGFDGFVMSDWGAVADRIRALQAGLDLEMPTSQGVRDAQICEAVKAGELDEKVLDEACVRILNIVYKAKELHDDSIKADFLADHDIAAEIAEETQVLLKNDNAILPLNKEAKVAFIGKYAAKPRFQGGGSSHINCIKVTSALDAAKELGITNITYAQGFDDAEDKVDEKLVNEAVEAAKNADVAVVFAGLPDSFESEGFDRKHMRIPECQNSLIEKLAAVQKNIVVVLHNGSPVEMPWVDKASAILESYLSGEGVGTAQCKLLYGMANPSGRLAETFPVKYEDNPSYLTGFGEGDYVNYAEGIFVGYRYYDKKNMDVLFPFGHGLSYTTFEYSNLTLDKKSMKDTDTLKVSVDVTNTGKYAGKEVVQLYVSDKESTALRPVKELKAFDKIELQPGETKTVTFELGFRDLAYFEPKIKDWYVESGEFDVIIGKSAKTIALSASVMVESQKVLPVEYTEDTTCGDIIKNPKAKEIIKPLLDAYFSGALSTQGESSSEAISEEMNEAMIENLPLHAVMSFAGRPVTPQEVKDTVAKLKEI